MNTQDLTIYSSHNFFLLSQPLRLSMFHLSALVYELQGFPAFQCVIYHINYFIRKLFVENCIMQQSLLISSPYHSRLSSTKVVNFSQHHYVHLILSYKARLYLHPQSWGILLRATWPYGLRLVVDRSSVRGFEADCPL